MGSSDRIRCPDNCWLVFAYDSQPRKQTTEPPAHPTIRQCQKLWVVPSNSQMTPRIKGEGPFQGYVFWNIRELTWAGLFIRSRIGCQNCWGPAIVRQVLSHGQSSLQPATSLHGWKVIRHQKSCLSHRVIRSDIRKHRNVKETTDPAL